MILATAARSGLSECSDGPLCASVIRDVAREELPCTGWRDISEFVEPSATARTAFEIRISGARLRVGMPELDFWFVDAELDRPVPMQEALVQFAHYSYTPLKCDGCDAPDFGRRRVSPGGRTTMCG